MRQNNVRDDVGWGLAEVASLRDEAEATDEEAASSRAWLDELGDLVRHLLALLRRQRAAMARRDLRLLGLLLAEQEEIMARLNAMATSPAGERLLAPIAAVSGHPADGAEPPVYASPELVSLYRRILSGLVDLAAANRANQHFIITAQRAIQGAAAGHSRPEGPTRLTSYTRQGRLAV